MSIKLKALLLTAVTLLISMSFTLRVEDVKNSSKEFDIIGVRAVDVNSSVHNLGIENKKAFPVTVVFIDIGCVISQRMIPHLNELYKTATIKGVKFYGVVSNPKVKWEEAKKFKEEFKIDFPLLFDSNGDLAERMQPSVVPESFVFDINDQLLYYGRINDQYIEVGKYSKHIKSADLLNVITLASEGKKPSITHQVAKGCIFEPWNAAEQEITFNKFIEPITRANCVSCHKPNDIGPFPLITYDEVARRGKMVEYVTKKKFMPIWKAEKGYGKFANEHSLSEYQIDLIKKWVEGGKLEGEQNDLLPAEAPAKSEWKLGEPDLILKMEPYQLPASGDDRYRVFVMKDKIPKGKIIKAIDFKPGDASVVHHSTVFLDYTGKLSQYDEEDPLPGYDAFKKGGTMEFGSAVPICGWAPGVGPYSYPDNVGFYVQENATLAFENHYHLTGKEATDESYIGVYYANQPVEKYITGSIIGSQRLQVPAGNDHFEKTIWTYVPVDIELYDLTPHMHYIGKEVTVDIVLPDGTEKPLLKINDWDLRWQSVYTLRNLTLIPKGSFIKARFVYDNSEDNHDNPYYPPKELYWGWGSNDEMCAIYFSYIPSNVKDYGKMLTSSFASFEHTYPLEERIDVTKDNLQTIAGDFATVDVWSSKGQKMLISAVESSLSEELLLVLQKNKASYKDEITFKVNYSELLLADAYLSLNQQRMIKAAVKSGNLLQEVVDKSSINWNATMSYAKIMVVSGIPNYVKNGVQLLEQLMEYQESVEKKDKHAIVYWELGKYYYGIRNDDKAEEVLKRGLEIHPDNSDLNQELASEGRIVKKTLN